MGVLNMLVPQGVWDDNKIIIVPGLVERLLELVPGTDYVSPYKIAIMTALNTAYAASQLVRSIIDNLTTEQPLTIAYVTDKAEATLEGSYYINFDTLYPQTREGGAGFVNSVGELQPG